MHKYNMEKINAKVLFVSAVKTCPLDSEETVPQKLYPPSFSPSATSLELTPRVFTTYPSGMILRNGIGWLT